MHVLPIEEERQSKREAEDKNKKTKRHFANNVGKREGAGRNITQTTYPCFILVGVVVFLLSINIKANVVADWQAGCQPANQLGKLY